MVNIVLLAISPDFGKLRQENVKAVNKMHILILFKINVSIVLTIDHYGMEINASLAQLDQILI